MRQPLHGVVQPGACHLACDHATEQDLPLQVLHLRDQREGADKCGQHRNQPQHEQQRGAAHQHP